MAQFNRDLGRRLNLGVGLTMAKFASTLPRPFRMVPLVSPQHGIGRGEAGGALRGAGPWSRRAMCCAPRYAAAHPSYRNGLPNGRPLRSVRGHDARLRPPGRPGATRNEASEYRNPAAEATGFRGMSLPPLGLHRGFASRRSVGVIARRRRWRLLDSLQHPTAPHNPLQVACQRLTLRDMAGLAKQITVRLPAAILRALDREARAQGVPQSFVVRRALSEFPSIRDRLTNPRTQKEKPA